MRELEHAPLYLVTDIMELRAYARAKHLIDTAQKEEDVPVNPMTELVLEIQNDILQERKKK